MTKETINNEEIKDKSSESTTTVIAETEEKNEETKLKNIHPAILIMYGEFLGYVSPILTTAEKVCKGETIDENVMKFIEVEAAFIFKKMKEEYTLEELRGWYDDFYEVAFKEYETNINKAKDKNNEKPVVTTTNTYPSRYAYDEYEDWD